MSENFPKNFLWGASTSAHQVEGNNTNNNWWQWEQNGNTEPSGLACDHYHRYREDFRLAKELGHNAHRFGLEWSRLEPEEGKWDKAEWDHYRAVLDELSSLDIEPVVTLHHFTIPLWLSRKGGWLNSDSPEIFARFAEKTIQELGDGARYWITINEPNILATLSYLYGEWPPCSRSMDKTMIVLRNMIRAHSLAYPLMKNAGRDGGPLVGIAKAVTAFHPCSPLSLRDRMAAHLRNLFHNHGFINCCVKGTVKMPGLPRENLPAEDTLDFIGLNYYFRQFVNNKAPLTDLFSFGEVCSTEHHPGAGELTDMGWEIYPEGLFETIKALSVYHKPMIITENGLATTDDGQRRRYIRGHLAQVLRALKAGYDIKGYLHWSLMDNFEWAHGYSRKFGLVGVDFKTQERTVRDSARYYSQVIHENALDFKR